MYQTITFSFGYMWPLGLLTIRTNNLSDYSPFGLITIRYIDLQPYSILGLPEQPAEVHDGIYENTQLFWKRTGSYFLHVFVWRSIVRMQRWKWLRQWLWFVWISRQWWWNCADFTTAQIESKWDCGNIDRLLRQNKSLFRQYQNCEKERCLTNETILTCTTTMTWKDG